MRNQIHDTVIIESGAKIGMNNYFGPYCVIKSGTIIGDNNRFEAFVSIGTPPEHRDYFKGSPFPVIIGDNCTIREFCTINAGTKQATTIGNNVVMLRNSHIGHDCIVEDNCNLSCNVAIGGHSYLFEGCNFGLNSVCHQFSVIGAYAFIGMSSVVTKDAQISPGDIFVGSPAKYLKQNQIGLQRAAITPEELAAFYTEWLQKT